MRELVVIAGPANTGKYPLAKKLLDEDPRRLLVHRDPIRKALSNPCDEWIITLVMHDMAFRLLESGHDVVVCAWNLEPEDRVLWHQLAFRTTANLRWLDVREPDVAALIPPLEGT